MPDYAAVYRGSRERTTELVRAAPPDALARTVPAAPEWSVADTVAHLVAVADDVLAGRLTDLPDDARTAEQVARRRGRPIADVLADWDELGPRLEAALAARRVPPQPVHDAVVHEADLRAALGAGRPPDEAWRPLLRHAERGFGRWSAGGALVLEVDGRAVTIGSGEPVATAPVDAYELWRALFGRRSRAQVAAWAWTGEPGPLLADLSRFGPTEVDLHEPA